MLDTVLYQFKPYSDEASKYSPPYHHRDDDYYSHFLQQSVKMSAAD